MIAQQEVTCLEEKVQELQRDLASYEAQVEQLRRSGSSKAEAGKASEATLHSTIAKLREDLHAVSAGHEKQLRAEKDALERRVREAQARQEDQRREHEGQLLAIKTDLRAAREDAARLQHDLQEAEDKIKEVESGKLLLQQEVSRLMEDTRAAEERRTVDFQAAVKGLDHEKKDLQKKLHDRETKISNMELNESKNADLIARLTSQLRELNLLKQEAQRAAADAANRLKAAEADGVAKAQEAEALRLRIATEDERHKAARHEAARLKSKVAEYEREREGLNAEIALVERRLAELEDHHNAREAHLQTSLDESRDAERRLLEDKKAADNFINQLQQQVADLKVSASRDAGRAEALQQQLGALEAHKEALERRLHATYAAIRTITHATSLPQRKEGGVASELPAALAESLAGLEKDRSERTEVDPEAIRLELRTLMNLISTLECERVSRTLMNLISTLECERVEELRARIAAAAASEADLKDKLSAMNRSLKETVAATSGLEDELNRSQSALTRTDSDRRQLEERLAACQASLAELRRQKEQATEAKQKAQQDLSNAEIRNADLEMKLNALRGNLGERSSAADDLIAKVTRLEHEKMEIRGQLSDLERKLAVSEAEKRDFEKFEFRGDKNRTDLKNLLDKYSSLGPDAVDAAGSLSSLRVENLELRRKLDEVEGEKTSLQQKHLAELRDQASEQRRERQGDAEKLRRLAQQLETLRQEKERCTLRIHALEQQVV
ncbi:rootletin [Hyalella azteca]|uniref:Rootletin n=1 Tax=Hyalella azteca TaxID=294128 RepID=A0A979FNW2_HYAAZ|nr:rootletin [Hyalella azteca]